MRYLVVNQDGVVINSIDWDGSSKWSPPSGCQAIKNDPSDAQDIFEVNDTWDGQSFHHTEIVVESMSTLSSPGVEVL